MAIIEVLLVLIYLEDLLKVFWGQIVHTYHVVLYVGMKIYLSDKLHELKTAYSVDVYAGASIQLNLRGKICD